MNERTQVQKTSTQITGAPGSLPGQTGLLQRKCACGTHTIAGGQCSACDKNQQTLQRSTRDSKLDNRDSFGVPPIVHDVLRSAGQPLDATTRAFMEPRFGHDFSRVRVHADSRATESARAVNALAYTVSDHIVFQGAQYGPASVSGQGLLAHELTHVIQQGGRPLPSTLKIGPKSDAHEGEADLVAQAIRSGSTAHGHALRAGASNLQLQRETASDADTVQLDPEEADAEVNDTTEVKDGDAAVNAVPDAAEVSEEPSLKGSEASDKGAGETAEPAQAGPKAEPQTPTVPKTPPKTAPKAPPKTITKIEVDQAAQTMTLIWSDGTKEGPRPISTGKGQPNTKDDPCKTQKETNCTPNGTFTVGSMGNGSTKNSHGDRMSWYVGFVDDRGIGVHNSQPVPGTPASHGCVRVGSTAADDAFAKKINKNVVPGKTTVEVSGKAATKPWKKAAPAPKTPKKKK